MSFKGDAIRHNFDFANNHLVAMAQPGAFIRRFNLVTEATAANVTYTAAQFLGGLIQRDPAGGARTDVTPTATAILNAIGSTQIGSGFLLVIKNTADAAETITMSGGTGVTIVGTATIAQNNTKLFLIHKTGLATVKMESLGTLVH